MGDKAVWSGCAQDSDNQKLYLATRAETCGAQEHISSDTAGKVNATPLALSTTGLEDKCQKKCSQKTK